MCGPPAASFAQGDTIRLRFKIIDSFTRETIERVSVKVCERDSTTLLRDGMERDREFINSVASVDDYYGDVPRRPVYVVKVSHEGYEAQSVRLTVPARKYGRRVKEWHAGDIVMRKKSSTFDRLLGEATVKASRVAMVVKGDTVEYDARAFQLAEGSMLDNLMAMLPGMVLTEDGRIFVNGEFVEKLMVNGRDFFKGNPKVALDNLPAYTVEKIRAYHEGPEWEHLIDDKNQYYGKRPMVVDVRLKREYALGWMANAEAGGGLNTRNGRDGMYIGRLFAMRYTGHSGLALYGSLNNLNDNQSPGRKGEWKKMDVTQGERTVKVGGVNLDIDGKRTGTKFSSTIEARREDIVSRNSGSKLTGEGLVSQLLQNEKNGDAGQTELKWNGKITTRSKRTFFRISPFLKYLHNRNEEQQIDKTSTSSGTETDIWEDTYMRLVTDLTRGDNWKTGITLNGYVKSPFSGKNYNLSFEANYAHADNRKEQTDVMGYADEVMSGNGWDTKWRDVLPSMSYDYMGRIARNLIDNKHKQFSYKMELNYSYKQAYKSGARTRELGGWLTTPGLPSAEEFWLTDWGNSFHTDEMGHTHSPGLYVHIDNWWVGFDGSLYANFERRNIRDTRNDLPQSLQRRDFHLNFYGILSTIHGARLTYFYTSELPTLLHLLDVRDASDPLHIYLGNPDLKKTTKHYIQLSYTANRVYRQRTLYAGLQAHIKADAVGNARSYDMHTGITTYRPQNINGNWRGRFDLDYGQTLDKAGRLSFLSNALFTLTHSVDFSGIEDTGDPFRSVVDNYLLSEELSLNYRTQKGIHIGAKGKVAYTKQRFKPLAYRSNESTDYSYGLTFTMPVTKHLGFETDLMAYARRGYWDKTMNTTEWVWNASLSYTLGKQKEWLIRAVGFDLLHQLSSVRRELNEQGYAETRYNTVPSYATLNITYRLNIQPKGVRSPL